MCITTIGLFANTTIDLSADVVNTAVDRFSEVARDIIVSPSTDVDRDIIIGGGPSVDNLFVNSSVTLYFIASHDTIIDSVILSV